MTKIIKYISMLFLASSLSIGSIGTAQALVSSTFVDVLGREWVGPFGALTGKTFSEQETLIINDGWTFATFADLTDSMNSQNLISGGGTIYDFTGFMDLIFINQFGLTAEEGCVNFNTCQARLDIPGFGEHFTLSTTPDGFGGINPYDLTLISDSATVSVTGGELGALAFRATTLPPTDPPPTGANEPSILGLLGLGLISLGYTTFYRKR